MSASWILPYFFFICLFQNSKLLSIKVAHFVFQIFGSAQGTSSLQLCTKFERLLFITSVKRTATQVVYFLFDCPHFWCCSGSILQTLWLLCLLEGEFANFIGVSDAHKDTMQFWMVLRILPLKMDLIQEFFILFTFWNCAVFIWTNCATKLRVLQSAQRSCCDALGAIANQGSLQLVYKVTWRVYYVTLTSPHQ